MDEQEGLTPEMLQSLRDMQERLARPEKDFLLEVLAHRDIGFGRMMQIISFAWHEIEPTGAFMVGTCYGLDEEQAKIQESIKRSDPLPYSIFRRK